MKSFFYIIIIGSLISISSCSSRIVANKPTSKKVTVIKTPPRTHKIVYIKGKRYYKWNGRHYKKTKRGYIIVKI